ncbi:hypothetical protein [Pedobacter cryoconitis]|uniref:Uncharacterized protein n=1 Tax=Pedobacter cryoconitis TaxID=188932 RepID=A0A7X0MIF2_9SPHI|nr:hypothetical protein [Pedobacter cryoconitis]MBB6498470.1 hypothetical protein [Pedobacter cryoconitis]
MLKGLGKLLGFIGNKLLISSNNNNVKLFVKPVYQYLFQSSKNLVSSIIIPGLISVFITLSHMMAVPFISSFPKQKCTEINLAGANLYNPKTCFIPFFSDWIHTSSEVINLKEWGPG